MKKTELLKRIGSMESFCRAEEFTFDSGAARGSRGIRVKCGELSFTVLPDRCMDIAHCEFRGVPMSFDSDCGIVHPAFYNENDFSRSFTAGLLTTCGLSNVGRACTDEQKDYGQHGRISNTPAYDVNINRAWMGSDYVMTISGKMKQTALFGEKLELIRTITLKLGENTINIADKVVNNGFSSEAVMLLYHINFGYPLIDDGVVLTTNAKGPIPRDPEAEVGLQNAHIMEKPQHKYKEQVFFHESAKEGWARVENKNLDIYSEILYNGDGLPYLTEWKQMGEGDYVLGVEPGTNPPEGRNNERLKGRLYKILPQEVQRFDVKIKFGKIDK